MAEGLTLICADCARRWPFFFFLSVDQRPELTFVSAASMSLLRAVTGGSPLNANGSGEAVQGRHTKASVPLLLLVRHSEAKPAVQRERSGGIGGGIGGGISGAVCGHAYVS